MNREIVTLFSIGILSINQMLLPSILTVALSLASPGCASGLSTETPLSSTTYDYAPLEMKIAHHEGKFGEEYNQTVSESNLHVWKFWDRGCHNEPSEEGFAVSVHVEVGDDAPVEDPVECHVKFGKETLQLTLPFVSESGRVYRSAKRTMCSDFVRGRCMNQGQHGKGKLQRHNGSQVQVAMSTTNLAPIKFKLSVRLENNLVRFNDENTVQISVNSPALFKLTKARKHSLSQYALLSIDSTDNFCATVSLQGSKCPIFDQENNVNFRGLHNTMSKTAAVSIKMSDLEEGRHLIFVMHEDDSVCDSTNQKEKDHVFPDISKKNDPSLKKVYDEVNIMERYKNIKFTLTEKISDEVYLYSVVGVVSFLLGFSVVFAVVYFKYLRASSPKSKLYSVSSESDASRSSTLSDTSTGSSILSEDNSSPEITNVVAATPEKSIPKNEEDEGFDLCCCLFLIPKNPKRYMTDEQGASRSRQSAHLSSTTLEDSAKKDPKQILKSAKRYAGNLFLTSAFYTIPVLQFVLLYQRVLDQTGNEDLCYHNFRCNHGLYGLAGFNHIISNISYIVLGFLFLYITYTDAKKQTEEDLEYGIHAHHGIYYAMGTAFIMQGVLSGLYHVCPTHLSYEFDTFFMYVTAVLCLVKIYQARHPDSNASAFIAFSCLAFILAFILTTIIFQLWYFWLFLTIAHIMLIFIVSVHIYSFGQWKLDKITGRETSICDRMLSLFFPFRQLSWLTVILSLANILNWCIAGFGANYYYQYGDVSTHFLVIFLVNLGLYFAIYVGFKIKNGESILWATKLYIGISLPIWMFGLWTFSKWPANWELSPAESRTLNSECVLLGFYDMHDCWHFISAFGTFFMFMFFYTLDDDLKVVRRSEIKVF